MATNKSGSKVTKTSTKKTATKKAAKTKADVDNVVETVETPVVETVESTEVQPDSSVVEGSADVPSVPEIPVVEDSVVEKSVVKTKPKQKSKDKSSKTEAVVITYPVVNFVNKPLKLYQGPNVDTLIYNDYVGIVVVNTPPIDGWQKIEFICPGVGKNEAFVLYDEIAMFGF